MEPWLLIISIVYSDWYLCVQLIGIPVMIYRMGYINEKTLSMNWIRWDIIGFLIFHCAYSALIISWLITRFLSWIKFFDFCKELNSKLSKGL